MGLHETIKSEPVSISVAIATLISAILGLLMAMGIIEPEVGAALGTIVTGSLVLVRKVVTPVEKVSQVLQQPVEVVHDLLKNVTIPEIPKMSEGGHP